MRTTQSRSPKYEYEPSRSRCIICRCAAIAINSSGQHREARHSPKHEPSRGHSIICCCPATAINEFWYPVRLVQFHRETDAWQVRWWCGCRFPADRPVDPQSLVPTADLVDELWQDRVRRRAIRFGQWTHAHDVPVGEDIIHAFHNVPYPPEMETILAPHKSAIQHLISLPRLENIQHLPVGRHLQQQGRKDR
ncbi:hypothetical protein EDD22DRAFT_616845 [Suillus occidentalis]|nr:hypothetical protein EDD22DRAFT_616845 [Suillus occidentalis]